MTEADEATQDPEQVPGPDAEPATAPAEAEAPAGQSLNADGRERPRFLLEFPADTELQRLVGAFEAGNYDAVRRGAPRLAQATEDPAVRAAARELRRRLDPDPLMKRLLWVALALFAFVVWYTYQNHAR